MPSNYEYLNRAWKSTCKILFGGEIGELEAYDVWLSEYVSPARVEKSAVSGKDVSFAVKDYAKGAKYLSFGEIDFGKKFEPLSINETKDIDSIVGAVQERAHYTGDIVLGNSKFVEASSNIVDSHFIRNSTIVSDSKYIAHSDIIRKCEYMFGVLGDAESAFTIKGIDGHGGKRLLECYTVLMSSDAYYSMRCQDCRDIMFCFGLRSKSHAIGNLQLPKEKYYSIKSKLLSEMRDKLKKEKKLFSLMEVIQELNDSQPEIKIPTEKIVEKGDMRPIEEAFTKTSSLLLGRGLEGVDKYADFLRRHVRQRSTLRSPFSKNKVYMAAYHDVILDLYKLDNRFVTEEEMLEVGKRSIGEEKLSALRMDSGSLAKIFGPIAFCAMNDTLGVSHNIMDCALVLYSESCYACDAVVQSKKCAYSFWPRESEYIFGSWSVWESQFAMKAYYSKKIARCFEVDNCESCSDLYFSHNCENVQDSLFCFNVKNKRNAIGNAEMEKEQYKRVKASVLEQLVDELEKRKTLKWDIYLLGANV